MIRFHLSLLASAALCVLGAGTVSAQDRPAVFFHGFGAEAADWAATANRLKASVAIEPHLPALAWRDSYVDQASSVQRRSEYASLPANAVAVGHSNGGVVAREWSKLHTLGGIVTIGTPHRGAPIFGHLLAWTVFSSSSRDALRRVASAFMRWSDLVWVYTFADEAVRWLADFSYWSVVNLIATLGVEAAMPVAYDMLPDSPYLSGLNSASNLAREALAAPNRVGIVSVAHNFYFAGPARAIAPEHGDVIATAMYGAAFTLLFWGNYTLLHAPISDWAAMNQAFALLDAGTQILQVDPWYCRLISTKDATECLPNDGIVPAYSQAFPGAPNMVIGENNDGPAHKQEKQMSDDALFAALTFYAQVPRRTQVPMNPIPAEDTGDSDDPTPGDPADPADPDPDSGEEERQPVTITTGVLVSGAELRRGDSVTSTSGRFHFCYQGDGNLVLYDVFHDGGWQPLWAAGTVGASDGFVAMQGDGNLVVYDSAGVPQWSSDDSLGHPGAWLAVQNDGNVVIYDPDGTPLWHTGTVTP